MRFLTFAIQVTFAALILPLAEILHERHLIVPRSLSKSSPLDAQMLLGMALFFIIAHGLILSSIWAFEKLPPFTTLRRFFIEGYGAMIATSFAASGVFLFTDIPFAANFFAWVFVIVFVGYLVLYGVFRAIGPSLESYERTDKTFLGLILSPWTLVTFLLVSTPGLLAILYKESQPFSNAVNMLKARLSMDADVQYVLEDAFPGLSFNQPMTFFYEPGRDAFLTLSRDGLIYRHTLFPWTEEILLDLREEVGSIENEMGAYNFVLHPDYGEQAATGAGQAFVYFTHTSGTTERNRLIRFDLSEPTREEREASRATLWDLGRPPTGAHNGGGMFFGPDGFLYVSLGDLNVPYLAQRIDEMLISGIFRLDVDMRGGDVSTPIRKQPQDGVTDNYFIPTSNPWYGVQGVLEEYWAHGLRNPWRMSWDEVTQSIWLGDVGKDKIEEISQLRAGDNAQWPYLEGPESGFLEKPETVIGNEVPPVYFYPQTALARAVLGGFVYRGDKFSELNGSYIFADNMGATIFAFDLSDPMGTVRQIAQGGQFGQLGMTSISTDADGDIYITFLGSKDTPTGEIVRLALSNGIDGGVSEENDSGSEEERLAALVAEVDTAYLSFCGRCHGDDGRGASELDIGVARPDFTSAAWQLARSDEGIYTVIAQGGEAVGLSAIMPGWNDVLSPEEIELLARKIRSFGEN